MELFDKIKKGIILLSLCLVCLGQIFAQNAAKIGTTEYATLQDAVDAAYDMTGNVTVELVADIEGEFTVVREKAGLHLTIEGDDHTIKGQILIFNYGNQNNRSLTIQNIYFTDNGYTVASSTDALIFLPDPHDTYWNPAQSSSWWQTNGINANNGTVFNNYVQDVFIRNCTFTIGSTSVAAVKSPNSHAKFYGVELDGITVSGGHSMAQFNSPGKFNGSDTAVRIKNCNYTVNPHNGINITGGDANIIFDINNNTLTGLDGYALRIQNGGANKTAYLSDNTFSSGEGIILKNNDPVATVNISSGNYNGPLDKATGTAANQNFVLTGGTYNQPVATVQGYCADGYLAIDEDPSVGYCTVRKQFVVTFNNNGGEGDMDPAYVNPATGEFVVPACTFTNGEWTFDKWNTKADGTGTDLNVDDVMTLTSDTILYAQWRGVAKIGETYYTTLNAAAAAVPTGTPTIIEILQNLNFYDISGSNLTGKTITFTGTPTDTLTLTNAAHAQTAASGADLTFEGITLKNDMTSDVYRGIIHLNKLTINDCEIIGFMMGYAETFICNNCTFTKTGKYHMWTYGSNATFNSCTFNSYNNADCKAVNVYKEGNLSQPYRVITFNDCVFNSTPAVTELDNSAIQINSEKCCFVVNINNCTANGYINNSSSVTAYPNLVNNKSTSVATTLYIDGNQILKQGSCDPVAQIGDTYYNTLQTALDAAYEMTGDVTIELLKNTSGYSIVRQKAGLNITIEGNDHTLAGQIIVDGDGRASGTETLTIQNIAFNDDGSHFYTGTDAFVLVPSTKTAGTPYYTNKYNYAHNITIDNCDFKSTSSSLNVVGIKATSGAGAYNVALTNCAGDNLHSLAQLTGTTGATFANCKVPNGDSFINVSGGAGDYVITDCKFVSSLSDGYGIRDKDGSSAIFTIERDTINASKALVFGKAAGESPAPSGQMNVSSGVYDGTVSIIPTASTATFVFTGGTFSEPKATVDGYCAYGYAAVANDPDDEHCTVRKLEVARIGTTTYPYLQDALDSARTMTGDVTIELLKNIEGYSIVRQKAGLNLTIEGNNDTIYGQIIIHGDGRLNGDETLTIQNVNFKGDQSNFYSGTDAFIAAPKTTTLPSPFTGTGNGYNYCHNVTVNGCTFNSTSVNSPDYDVVALKLSSGKNIAMDNCTGDNLHSLAQFTGTTNATITNDTITNSQSFVNVSGGAGEFVIANCEFTGAQPDDGYAVRENGTSSANITLTDNNFSAYKSLVLGKGGAQNPSGHINVTSGNYNGLISKETVATSTAEFVFTGGTFDQDSATVAQWCADGYFAVPNDPSTGFCTVYRMYTLIYDANGGDGTMDTIRVKKDVPEADRTLVVADCEFIPFDAFHTFAIWNTVSDSTGISFNPGDPIVMNSDTVLYAIWKEGVTIYYDANGGTGTIPYQSKDLGVDVILSDGAAFSRTDSTLYRWNTAADELGDNYDLGGTYSADVNVTMYAVWRLNLDMTMSSTDVVCYGENNGTDTVKMIGGDTPFQLVLSGTALSENDTVRNIMDRTYIFENLKPGDYTVTLTDVLGKDTITGNFTIDQPDTLVATFTSVPYAPCPLMGEGEYAVSMTTTGGNGGNVIAWGGDAVDVNDLSTIVTSEADDRDRTYNITVTVTDQKGCTAVIDTSFTVSPVIANDGTTHSNTTMTIATINQSILYGCDTVIRDFGTPSFTFTNAAITEAILDTIYNNVSTAFPDSIFTLGENTIIWTAVDTCGHEVTAEQVVNITHKPCPSAFDYHGIEYPAVRIGCDCWTTKNLASTQYSDGDQIPDVRSYPINTRASIYGNLYTYEAAMDGADVAAAVASNTPVQGACPAGWHVPSQAEVEALMSSSEVQALMSQGTWIPDNGTNATGFTMLPGGFYNSELDRYERMYVSAYIWIATPETAIYHACEFGAACSSLELIPGNLTDGLSIRCVITKPAE